MEAYGFDESNPGKATPLPQPDEQAPGFAGPGKERRAVTVRDPARNTHRPTPAAVSGAPSVGALVNALRRRWAVALVVGLVLGVGVGIGTWFMRPVHFMAATLLHASPHQESILDRQQINVNISDYQRTQIALVKTRTVLNAALRDVNVSKLQVIREQIEPIDWLQKQLIADFPAPDIFRIGMRGDNPKEIEPIVKAVGDSYLSEIVNKDKEKANNRWNKLKDLYEQLDESLRGKRAMLRSMEDVVGPGDAKFLANKHAYMQDYLKRLQFDLMDRDSRLISAKEELAVLKANEKYGVKPPVPEQEVNELLDKDDEIVKSLKDINFLEHQLQEFKQRWKNPETVPAYKDLVAQVQSRRKTVDARRKELRPGIEERLRTRLLSESSKMRLVAEKHVEFLNRITETLRKSVEETAKKTEDFNGKAVDVKWLDEEIKDTETLRKTVGKQKQELELQNQAAPRVYKVEEAQAVPTSTETSRVFFALMVGFGTLCASVFGVSYWEFKARRVSEVEEVTQGLKIHLMGSLPNVPRRALAGSTAAKDVYWQNRLTESVDAIRTTLMNAARFEGMRVVMVTSAVGGEGKTLLACHLAASLARAGLKTLLIDGDLRRPSVHRLFGLPLPGGLSELLQGEIDAATATHTGLMDGLSVISAGQRDGRSAQALAGSRIREVLDELRGSYEFIVVDSAPVLPIADSQLIGQHTDGVVFSIMRDVSRLPQVYAAYERLAVLRIRTLGAVVNGVSGRSYGSGDYYYIASTPSEPAPVATE